MGLTQAGRYFNVEGLTTRNREGRVQPRLATTWQSSDDGLIWRFQLRDDVTFHDGTKVDATAVSASLTNSVNRPGARALYPGLIDVSEIVPSAEFELTITLKRRSSFLLEDLEFPITKLGPKKETIGTGPFKVASSSREEIVLEPHESYYMGRPQIDRLIIQPYPTLRTAWASLMREEIDVLFDLAHGSAEFVGTENVAFYSYLRNYIYLIAFNSARPQLASPTVRRALNAAVNRQSLIGDVLNGHGLAASGPLWPFHWAYDSTLPGYTHDPSLASATLDAAGLTRTGSGRNGVPSRLSFVCLVPENYAVLERLALHTQKQLYDIGVDMQLEAVGADEYNGRILKGDFDAVIIDMISGPVFTRPYSFWRWGGEPTVFNVFGYRSAAADRWFDALRYASNETEYRAAASQLQRTLIEDPPALFLAWNERTRVVSRRFNVPAEPGRDPMPTLWQWTIRGQAASTTH